ncbi:MAG: GNAT family N-acetyltransferase [Holophagaceae bacterium]|nr:GNAT family N-acetyltransferase [Holophagaceae bacterium]
MDLRWIPHLSPAYALAVALRRDVLRKPLGLEFSEAQLADEAEDLHLAAFDGTELVGCLLLSDRGSGRVQMRQVAVRQDLQGQGLGALLVRESEAEALRRGFATMILHARETAVPFYLKLGYGLVGEPFAEVGIPHRSMEKVLV